MVPVFIISPHHSVSVVVQYRYDIQYSEPVSKVQYFYCSVEFGTTNLRSLTFTSIGTNSVSATTNLQPASRRTCVMSIMQRKKFKGIRPLLLHAAWAVLLAVIGSSFPHDDESSSFMYKNELKVCAVKLMNEAFIKGIFLTAALYFSLPGHGRPQGP